VTTFDITPCAVRRGLSPHNKRLDAKIEVLLKGSGEPLKMAELARKLGQPVRRVGDRVRRMMQLDRVAKSGERGNSATYRWIAP
jgi:chromosome segregation and condensation protein ScpB